MKKQKLQACLFSLFLFLQLYPVWKLELHIFHYPQSIRLEQYPVIVPFPIKSVFSRGSMCYFRFRRIWPKSNNIEHTELHFSSLWILSFLWNHLVRFNRKIILDDNEQLLTKFLKRIIKYHNVHLIITNII